MKYSLIAAISIWLVALAAAIIISKKKYKKHRILTPVKILLSGTFISAFIMFLPLYFEGFEDSSVAARISKSVLMSVQHAMRLLLVDDDFAFVTESLVGADSAVSTAVSLFMALLFVCAPILTFDFLLSFFKNTTAFKRYIYGFFSDVYVFSELNERSITLARDLRKKHKKCAIVFTGVTSGGGDKDSELYEDALEIGALCFTKNIMSVNFACHSKKRDIYFFVIGNDDSEQTSAALELLEKYKLRENTHLYLFSNSVISELAFAQKDKGLVKAKRIKPIRSLIYRTLYDMEKGVIEQKNKPVEKGEKLQKDIFSMAREREDGTKHIGAVIVGCGAQGGEMLRTLVWFCQMDGYSVSIDAFDRDILAESRFSAMCPELMSDKYNGVYVDGEAEYFIKFHTESDRGIDVFTQEFREHIKELTDTTYVFVSLGNDEENIKAAVELRAICEQMRIYPMIQAVVYDSEKKKTLKGIKNFKGQAYNIEFIGDLDSLYCEDVIIASELEKNALKRHEKHGASESFWQYEYNYRSSMASALHMYARIACEISGADRDEEALTEEERAVIEPLEHRRWNAYMRSEGYVYSGSKDKASRNDLGRMHHDLVTFDELSDEEKRKDSRVGTR